MIGLLGIFIFSYFLIASEKVDKTIAACLGASAMIIFHYIPHEPAMHHIDLNVIFLLVGMMMIVNVLSTTGVFEFLAIWAAKLAKGQAILIMIMFLLITAILSALLDNVTTVILIAPITILVAQILEIPAVPFLIAEAVFSNIGGTATLIGDPPNVLIGSWTHWGFNSFIENLGPIVLVIMLIELPLLVFCWRKKLKTSENTRKRILAAIPKLAILNYPKMYISLTVFSIVLIGFFFSHALGIEPGIIALAGGFTMVLCTKSKITHIMEKVEWTTIFFFIGLFILVGALQENGIFLWLGNKMLAITGGNLLLTTMMVLWGGAILSAIVDNIPLVIAMLPLLQSVLIDFEKLNPTMTPEQISHPLFWALALGACLGGNGTLVGASANVVIAQIARRNKYQLSFWTFTKTGFPIMILSLAIASVCLYLKYFIN